MNAGDVVFASRRTAAEFKRGFNTRPTFTRNRRSIGDFATPAKVCVPGLLAICIWFDWLMAQFRLDPPKTELESRSLLPRCTTGGSTSPANPSGRISIQYIADYSAPPRASSGTGTTISATPPRPVFLPVPRGVRAVVDGSPMPGTAYYHIATADRAIAGPPAKLEHPGHTTSSSAARAVQRRHRQWKVMGWPAGQVRRRPAHAARRFASIGCAGGAGDLYKSPL